MPTTPRPALRAAGSAAALIALAAVVGRVAWAEVTGDGAARPEALLIGVVGAAAVLLLTGLAAAVLRVGVALHRSGPPMPDGSHPLPLGRIGRLLAGLLIGAGGLAPQVAGASVASPGVTPTTTAAVTAAGVARTATATDPVDPTYLGPGTPTAPASTPGTRPAPPTAGPAAPSPAPTATAPMTRGTATAPTASTTPHVVVRPGDTLWGLTQTRLRERYGAAVAADDAAVARAVLVVHAANRGVVGSDPDLIRPGTLLALPDLTDAVRPGGRSRR